MMLPWQDVSELALIREWFYPSRAQLNIFDALSEDGRAKAVAKTNIWTFDTSQLPPAIIATADLTDATLHYERLVQSKDPTQYRSVQFMLAFAFLRFVNSFVDRDIARASNAALSATDTDEETDRMLAKAAGESSMYAYAANINMPSRFVEMRHRVSHGSMPEIAVLVKYVEEGLAWLWDRWWKVNAVGDSGKALRKHQAREEAWTEYELKHR